MPEVKTERNGLIVSVMVAEHYKNRIHVIGRVWRAGEAKPEGDDPPTLLGPYEAFMVIADEWTDGYEIDINHDLENADEGHAEAMDYDGWTEEVEFFVPMILWGSDQSYDDKISDEQRELVADLD